MKFNKNSVIDNSKDFSMVETLKSCISESWVNEIKIATGYWDLKGMALLKTELRDYLQKGNRIQLLIGKDPYVYSNMIKEYPKHKLEKAKFPDEFIRVNINELELTDEYQDIVEMLLDYCSGENPQFEIKIYKRDENGDAQFMHAKTYIFIGEDDSCGIIGSSNFTKNGLQDNVELNYFERDSARVIATPQKGSNTKGHIFWFDEKWEESEAWTKEFLEQILKPSQIAKQVEKRKESQEKKNKFDITPYELYIKYLQTQFGDITDSSIDSILESYLPDEYNPLTYQFDAVKRCFSIMKRYGGFILGDVVGLGKTVVGLLVIKRFLVEAENLGRARKVLIVVPPAIKKAWEETISDFDKNSTEKVAKNIDFITTGSIGKISEEIDIVEELEDDTDDFDSTLKKEKYGLILVDESHNFRNSETNKYRELKSLIEQTFPHPFVGLLSATPQNNSPEDLKNQIYLFELEPNNSKLPNIGGGKLDSFFSVMRSTFNSAKEQHDPEMAKKILDEMSEEIRVKVLNDLVVRRTRTDIKKHYQNDSKQLQFPSVELHEPLKYIMDDELSTLFYDTMNAICPDNPTQDHIGFYRYSAITFFADEKNKKLYEKRNLTVEGISSRLAKIMQILLVKRLESSFSAFKQSLQNLLDYTENMICMLRNDCVFICPDIDVNKIFKENDSDFEKVKKIVSAEIARKGKNNRQFKTSDFKKSYIVALNDDLRIIKKLYYRWNKNEIDPKKEKFQAILNSKLFDKSINNPSGKDSPKLVIFTEAIDTLDTIARIATNAGHRVLKISAATRDEKKEVIKANFDANAKVQKDDYDVIVTTEVLAEGVNLHRSNVILNYDSPWNATRLMQRIGRVNRIGSKESKVHVFNFYPSAQGNEKINLVENAYAKLQSFHSMFGEDNQVFSKNEVLSEVDLSGLVEGEESPEGKYINELKQYKEENESRYEELSQIPLEQLGGCVDGKEDSALVVFSTEKDDSLVSVMIKENESNVVSPLLAMEFLRCDKNKTFEKQSNRFQSYSEIAKHTFNEHQTSHISSKDINKKITEVLGLIAEIKKAENDNYKDLTDESRQLLVLIQKAVQKKNNVVIKKMLEIKKCGCSIFGINADLQSVAMSLDNQVEAKYGKAKVSLYEVK